MTKDPLHSGTALIAAGSCWAAPAIKPGGRRSGPCDQDSGRAPQAPLTGEKEGEKNRSTLENTKVKGQKEQKKKNGGKKKKKKMGAENLAVDDINGRRAGVEASGDQGTVNVWKLVGKRKTTRGRKKPREGTLAAPESWSKKGRPSGGGHRAPEFRAP